MPRNPWTGDEPLTGANVVIIVASALAIFALTVTALVFFPGLVRLFEKMGRLLDHFVLSDSVFTPIVFPLSLFATWFVCVFIHECGHLIGGKLAGYRLEMFLVWPVLFLWKQGKRYFRILNRSDMAGFVTFQIPELANFRARYAIFVAGGPIANLAFAGVAEVLSKPLHLPTLERILTTAAAASLGIGVLNLIPFRAGVHSTDGSKLLMLAFQPERMKRLQAVIQLRSLSLAGTSPKDWPETVVKQAISSGAENAPERYHLFLFGYVWAGAKDDTQLAAECLEQCLRSSKSAGRSARNFLAMEAAIFHAWYRRDAEKSRTWKSRIKNLKTAAGYGKLRLKICEACLENRYQEALAEVEKFANELGKSSSPAMESLRRSWLEWKAQIEERAALTNAAASQ